MKGLNEKFVEEISRIKDPTVFLGVARVLKVQLMDDKDARSFEKIIEDVVESFCGAGRKRKKELLKLLRCANKEVELDAGNTEDSEETVPNENL